MWTESEAQCEKHYSQCDNCTWKQHGQPVPVTQHLGEALAEWVGDTSMVRCLEPGSPLTWEERPTWLWMRQFTRKGKIRLDSVHSLECQWQTRQNLGRVKTRLWIVMKMSYNAFCVNGLLNNSRAFPRLYRCKFSFLTSSRCQLFHKE